jgi:Trk K+ transport system NAD-binding subunit
LSDREVNEIADTPAGATFDVVNRLEKGTTDSDQKSDYQIAAEEAVSEAPVPSRSVEELTQELAGVTRNIAIIRDGKVEIERVGSTSQEAKKTP